MANARATFSISLSLGQRFGVLRDLDVVLDEAGGRCHVLRIASIR